jgi:hypothetical protein
MAGLLRTECGHRRGSACRGPVGAARCYSVDEGIGHGLLLQEGLGVDQVLAPELRHGDIVSMDNLGSHKGPDVRRVIEAGAGVKLLARRSRIESPGRGGRRGFLPHRSRVIKSACADRPLKKKRGRRFIRARLRSCSAGLLKAPTLPIG